MKYLVLIAAMFVVGSSAQADGQQVVTNAVAQYWATQYDGGVQYHTWQQGDRRYPGHSSRMAWDQMKSSPQGDIYSYTSSMCGSRTIRDIRISIDYVMGFQDYNGTGYGNQRQHGDYIYTCHGHRAVLTSNNETPVYFER